jgi:rod shape-determining protein MreD
MIRNLLPAGSVALLAVLAVLPWGAADAIRFALPLLPLTAIHHWNARRPAQLPAPFVFAVGLAMDVATHGPLGYWSLLALIAAALARYERKAVPALGPLGRYALFGFAMLLLAVIGWAVASLYFLRLIEWRPLLSSALAAVVAYPLLASLLGPIERLWAETPPRQILGRTE